MPPAPALEHFYLKGITTETKMVRVITLHAEPTKAKSLHCASGNYKQRHSLSLRAVINLYRELGQRSPKASLNYISKQRPIKGYFCSWECLMQKKSQLTVFSRHTHALDNSRKAMSKPLLSSRNILLACWAGWWWGQCGKSIQKKSQWKPESLRLPFDTSCSNSQGFYPLGTERTPN